MLDKLADLIVEKLERRIDHYIDLKFEAFQENILKEIAEARANIQFQFSNELPQLKKSLKAEITSQIVRGIKK